jgi:serine palmitoyltransferase
MMHSRNPAPSFLADSKLCFALQADLRRVLEKVQQTDKALGRKSRDQRRFIVVEGLYKNTGTICPLDELVALKHEFKYRLILDESFSFGTLGETGKGVMELFGKRHMYDAEIVTISLENSLGSIGGVTVGNEEVVDHQRLSGAGYCFSASSPPFTASAAIQSLQNLEKNPELVKILRDNVRLFHEKLKTVGDDLIPGTLVVTSDERSPIVYMELATEHDDGALLDAIADECLAKGKVALVSTKRYHAKQIPIPAIRLAISAAHTREDIDEVVQVLQQAVRANAKRAS